MSLAIRAAALVSALVLGAAACGCVYVPSAPAPEAIRFKAEIRRIQVNATTREEVRQRLGRSRSASDGTFSVSPERSFENGRFVVYDWSERSGEAIVQGSGGGPAYRYHALAIEFGADDRVTRVQEFTAPWAGGDLEREIAAWMKAQPPPR